MSEPCFFCKGPVNPHDEGTHKQVIGWVHGKKSDSMVLREYTDLYAHDHCIQKAKSGQSIDQPDLFGEDEVVEAVPTDKNNVQEFLDFMDHMKGELERNTGRTLDDLLGKNDD